MDELTPIELQDLSEGSDFEVKKAVGRDGRGELPKAFFETYSAMANTHGGVVVLGIEENPKGKFAVAGIQDVEKVLKSLWDNLNNKQVVSTNVLADQMVQSLTVHGGTLIKISIPRAERTEKPVYVGSNPLTGTFRRNYEGDYRCDQETVRRMIAEQVETIRDSRLIEHSTLAEIDESSLAAYRNLFKSTKPDHPWNTLDEKEFLRMIGGWTKHPDSQKEGLTLAGLLMFGTLRPILDSVPYYLVDYQELSPSEGKARWVDRITTDGTWSGNLFDFYRKVIQKLTSDLKVPFVLKGDERIDDTPVHEALREALINTLIHSDFTGRIGVLVVKRPSGFGFRNPGTMRMGLDRALDGGTSDCRNRNIQKMFQLVGFGEQAGSGLSKIFRNWKEQHWRPPLLWEDLNLERTVLVLRMVGVLPDEVVRILDNRFGPSFGKLSEVQQKALATAQIEGEISSVRLRSMAAVSPYELSKELAGLVKKGFLEPAGELRRASYLLPGAFPTRQEEFFTKEATSADTVYGKDSGTDQVATKYRPSSDQVEEKLKLLDFCAAPKGVTEMMRHLGLSHRPSFRKQHLSPLLKDKLLAMTDPSSPQSPKQRYVITPKGQKFLKSSKSKGFD